jgi:hypothetical protein
MDDTQVGRYRYREYEREALYLYTFASAPVAEFSFFARLGC